LLQTLVHWIDQRYPELAEVGEPQTLQNGQVIKRPGIVHRLDRETSGVIIVCKTKEAHQFLKEQFQNRKVEKIYNAVVWGSFSEELREGKIDKPIGRSASDFRRWSAEYGAKGEMRDAVTEYRVLLPHPGLRLDPPLDHGREGKKKQEFSYLEVRPKTGRTHQIRVHMKAISHSVVCDRLYGPKINEETDTLGFKRLALHALSIKLKLPSGMQITIESPLPGEFEKAKQYLITP
jgi:23S rRNA pseudouridine1911/1915/1917 synthase